MGNEQDAVALLAAELDGLRFTVEMQPMSDGVALDPLAGVPSQTYAGRCNVVGRRGTVGPSLLLNGHLDVVPATEPERWTSEPFTPVRRDGWLLGRGAGDMKAGFAMGTLAIRALDLLTTEAVEKSLTFLGVIDEECTGNGTLAAARAGVLADAVVLLEPTDLNLLLGGVGVLWADIEVDGFAAHAESADRAVNPIEVALRLLPKLREFEEATTAAFDDPIFASISRPYNLNIGQIRAGDWPSSVPSVARIRLRVGYPRRWSPGEAEQRLRAAVAQAASGDDWLAAHPPRLRCSGFRAEGYHLPASAPLVEALSRAHEAAHGERPSTYALGSTTDARYYVNNFDRPALCYGPVARDIHGVDERVELDSIVRGARTLARFMATWWS